MARLCKIWFSTHSCVKHVVCGISKLEAGRHLEHYGCAHGFASVSAHVRVPVEAGGRVAQ